VDRRFAFWFGGEHVADRADVLGRDQLAAGGPAAAVLNPVSDQSKADPQRGDHRRPGAGLGTPPSDVGRLARIR
jgi:hypothetical protein